MADNQISVTVSADVAQLQSALQQASSAFESAAGTMAATASAIAATAKQAFDSLAAASQQATAVLQQASQQAVQQAQQTASQSLQIQQTYEAQKSELEIKALQEEVARDEQRIHQLSARLDRQAAEIQKYLDNVRNQHKAAANDINKIWNQAASQIDRELMSGFNRMIVSGGNLRQQMQRIAQQVETALLTAIEKTVFSWIAGEETKTAATVAGTTARTSAEQTAQGVGLASMALKAIKAIANDAWQTFSGIFAFLSPEMGPAAAGPAAAGAATVLAVAGNINTAAGGAWSLPADMLVFAHQEESILPANIAGPMRDFFTGAGNGGAGSAASGDVNFHVYAMDSRDVMNFFKRNGATLARVLEGGQRNFNPALR